MADGKIDGYSVLEQVIAGLFLVGTTAIVVHAVDRIRDARALEKETRSMAREIVSLSRISPSRSRARRA
jgi:hypothetical protein